MGKLLTEKMREEFFIRLYFNVSNGHKFAGLKRAYLDFNRTLKIKDGNAIKRNEIQLETQKFLQAELEQLIITDFDSQECFDKQHKIICEELIKKWSELSIGHSQKWINMTLKYWLLFGEERIPSIEKNAKLFHIPIDSYVLIGLFKEKNPKPWSKISNYNDYFVYQLKQRKKQTGKPPIVEEFIFFNNYKP